MVADPILVPFDAENAARLPTSATKEHVAIDFAIEQTSDSGCSARLLAVQLSGKQSETVKFQKRLQELSLSRGDISKSLNMRQSLKNGNSMHYQGTKIPLIHL